MYRKYRDSLFNIRYSYRGKKYCDVPLHWFILAGVPVCLTMFWAKSLAVTMFCVSCMTIIFWLFSVVTGCTDGIGKAYTIEVNKPQYHRICQLCLIKCVNWLQFWSAKPGQAQTSLSITNSWTKQGKRKRLRCTCPVGKWVFCLPCPTFNSILVLWASWKELKEQACYIACPEKCADELCPNFFLVLWMSKR